MSFSILLFKGLLVFYFYNLVPLILALNILDYSFEKLSHFFIYYWYTFALKSRRKAIWKSNS